MKRLHQRVTMEEHYKEEVRCLGPGMPEHTFMTDDLAGHRICPRCRRLIDSRVDLGPVTHHAIFDDGRVYHKGMQD